MARNFFEIGRLGRSQPTAIDYSEGLQPALDDLKARLDESKLKRDTLLSQMPTGVAIEKVPEVFRGKVTDFLTQNRQQYIEASKVIASGIRPDDERYISAMNTINSVKLRFDNLSNDLELYATTRKESLNQTNASLSVIKTLQTDHNNLASGEMTKTLAVNEDGNITYINNAGSVGLFKDDFKLNYQAETSFQTTVSDVKGELRVFRSKKGATYDSIREDALNAFDTFFNNTTVDGIRHAIFSDQDFMESVVAKLGVDTKDEEAVQRKISELVEMGDIENLKKQFKEFYTGENGEFERYFNEQPGYEPPTEKVSQFTSNFKDQQKILYKTLNEDDYPTIITADFLNSTFTPGSGHGWRLEGNEYVLLKDVAGGKAEVVTSFKLTDSPDKIRESINVGLMTNRVYSGFNVLQNRDAFTRSDLDDETKKSTDQTAESLTIPEPPEDAKDPSVFYRNINFSTFKKSGGYGDKTTPIAVWNKDTNEYDVRYGGGNQRVPVSKLQEYFKLIGLTDIKDVSNLAIVLSSEDPDEFNPEANYAKVLGVSSLKELKDIISIPVLLSENNKSEGPNKFSVTKIGIDAGGGQEKATLRGFIRTLRNYVKMINEIKQQAGE